jgi:NodT family efflux transporter outer membrane factor (OMF) lipoprotein
VKRALLGAGFALLAVLVAGCAVGPNYRRPSAPVPSTFKELAPSPIPTPAAGPAEWKPAQPRDDRLRGKWWEIFGDPELDALEEQVNVSNQNVARAEAVFRGARAAARGARADLFPTVGANASATRSKPPAVRSGASTGTTTQYELSADLSWELDVFGRIRRNLESNVQAAQATAGDLEAVRLALHAELAADYFLLHGLDAQKQLLDTNVAAFQTALQLTTNRFNQGVVSGVDVAQAQTLLETTRAQATDLSLTRAQLEHAIAILTGKPPAELTIAPSPITVAPPEIPVALPAELLERRPDIAASERRVAAANAQIGVAVAGFFPRLLLAASGGYGSSTLTNFFSLPNRFWSLGPSIVQTLFEGGKRRAAKEQAEASYDAAVATYRESVLTACQDIEDSLAALRILDLEAAQLADAVAAAERSLSIARNRYQGGVTTYLEVITAQSAALANERAAVDNLTRRMTASVRLVEALGGGWSASDLPTGFDILTGYGAAPGSEPRAERNRPE